MNYRLQLMFPIILYMAPQIILASTEPTLCIGKEISLYSCASSNKVISICRSKVLTKDRGIITYRYGKVGEPNELEYTSEANKFDEKFNYAYSDYAKGYTIELSFSIGEYQYTVHVDSHVYSKNASGVFIERNSKIIAYKECDNPYQNHKHDLVMLKDIFPVDGVRRIGTEKH